MDKVISPENLRRGDDVVIEIRAVIDDLDLVGPVHRVGYCYDNDRFEGSVHIDNNRYSDAVTFRPEHSDAEVAITLPRTDLEALLLDLEARKVPDLDTAPGTDRAIDALRRAWQDSK